jgi:hypothetical protein
MAVRVLRTTSFDGVDSKIRQVTDWPRALLRRLYALGSIVDDLAPFLSFRVATTGHIG